MKHIFLVMSKSLKEDLLKFSIKDSIECACCETQLKEFTIGDIYHIIEFKSCAICLCDQCLFKFKIMLNKGI